MRQYALMLAVAFLALCCLDYANGITCWDCASYRRPGSDPMTGVAYPPRDEVCETGVNQTRRNHYGRLSPSNCQICGKYLLRHDNRQVEQVRRWCESTDKNPLTPHNGCIRRDVRRGRAYMCFCDRNNCNTAVLPGAAQGLAYLGTLLYALRQLL